MSNPLRIRVFFLNRNVLTPVAWSVSHLIMSILLLNSSLGSTYFDVRINNTNMRSHANVNPFFRCMTSYLEKFHADNWARGETIRNFVPDLKNQLFT